MAYRSYRTAPRSFTFSKSIFVCTVLQLTAFGEIWTAKRASRGLSARAYCLSLHDTRCCTEYSQDTPTRVIHASDPGIAHQAITITLPWFVWGKLNGLTALVVATSKRAFHNYHPKLRNCWCLRHENNTKPAAEHCLTSQKKWGEYLGLRHVWREWACLDCILCSAMYADDVALPAFTRRTPAVQQSIDMACRRVVGLLMWAHAGTESCLPQPFLCLLQDSLYGFPRLFTATSEHRPIHLFTF